MFLVEDNRLSDTDYQCGHIEFFKMGFEKDKALVGLHRIAAWYESFLQMYKSKTNNPLRGQELKSHFFNK